MPKKREKKKIETRGRKKHLEILDLDDFYKAINDAQCTNKPVYIYFKDQVLCSTIENILKDSDIKYETRKKNDKIIYRLFSDRKDTAEDDSLSDFEKIFGDIDY